MENGVKRADSFGNDTFATVHILCLLAIKKGVPQACIPGPLVLFQSRVELGMFCFPSNTKQNKENFTDWKRFENAAFSKIQISVVQNKKPALIKSYLSGNFL